jgi:hypothetical protein
MIVRKFTYASLYRWAFMMIVTIAITMQLARADTNFVVVEYLPGQSIEIPRNWTVLSDGQRINLDTHVEAVLRLSGGNRPATDLPLAANYFESGKTVALMNIRVYPEMDVTQQEIETLQEQDLIEVDAAFRDELENEAKAVGSKVLSWEKTRIFEINSKVFLLVQYVRAAMPGLSGDQSVAMYRYFDGPRSLSVTLSVKRSQERLFGPIFQYMISTLELN